MSIRIRPATEQDIPAIHGLVAELADYINMRDQFTATQSAYVKDLEDGFFEAFVAEDTETATVVGMALYNFAYSTWRGRSIYLEDFVLTPAYRRQGIGTQLWEAIKQRGRERGCVMLRWQIAEDNTEAVKFYRAQGAIIDPAWVNGKLWL